MFADLDADLLGALEDPEQLNQLLGLSGMGTTLRSTLRTRGVAVDGDAEQVALASLGFSTGNSVLAVRNSDGRRAHCIVTETLNDGLFRVKFDDGTEQDVYVSLLAHAPSKSADNLTVKNTTVKRTLRPDGSTVVTTTLRVHDTKTGRIYNQNQVGTIRSASARASATIRPTKGAVSAPVATGPHEEFRKCLKELLHSEVEFAIRLEAIRLYEAGAKLILPDAAHVVIFGSDSLKKLVAASKDCTRECLENPDDFELQIILLWDYYFSCRELFHDQVTSRSVSHAPLQGLLQSDAEFRKFTLDTVDPVRTFLRGHGISALGELASLLFAPVQRLPRVLLLCGRMRSAWPEAPGIDALFELVREMVVEAEEIADLLAPTGEVFAGPEAVLADSEKALKDCRYNDAVAFVESLFLKDKSLLSPHQELRGVQVLSNAHAKLGDYSSALPYSQREKHLVLQLFGKCSRSYATSLHTAGVVQRGLAKYSEARASLKEATVLLSELDLQGDPEFASVLCSLAMVDVAEKKWREALTILSEAKHIVGHMRGDESYCKVLSQQALCYAKLNAWNEAIGAGSAAVHSYRTLVQDKKISPPELAKVIFNLAYAHSGALQNSLAIPLYEEALAIFKKSYGDKHSATTQCEHALSQCKN